MTDKACTTFGNRLARIKVVTQGDRTRRGLVNSLARPVVAWAGAFAKPKRAAMAKMTHINTSTHQSGNGDIDDE